VVGLGQGLILRRSRHAIGAALVEELAAAKGLTWTLYPLLGAFIAEYTSTRAERVLLVWPLVMYNLSGPVVAAAARRFDVASDAIVVLHDDLDTRVGSFKWRHDGTAGGNGIKSVIDSLGTCRVSRLRIGIGRPASKDAAAVVSYVLSDVPDADRESIRATMQREGLADVLLEGRAALSDHAHPPADARIATTTDRERVDQRPPLATWSLCAMLLHAYTRTLRQATKRLVRWALPSAMAERRVPSDNAPGR